jgi:hypothetical protein
LDTREASDTVLRLVFACFGRLLVKDGDASSYSFHFGQFDLVGNGSLHSHRARRRAYALQIDLKREKS